MSWPQRKTLLFIIINQFKSQDMIPKWDGKSDKLIMTFVYKRGNLLCSSYVGTRWNNRQLGWIILFE